MGLLDAGRQKQGIMGSFLKVDGNVFFLNNDLGRGIDKIAKKVTGGRGLVAVANLRSQESIQATGH